jgi:Bacterial Ig-like domain (group 2).
MKCKTKIFSLLFTVILILTINWSSVRAETIADLVTDTLEINNFYTAELSESQSVYYEITLPVKGTLKINFECNNGYGDEFWRGIKIFDVAGNQLYNDSVYDNYDDIIETELNAGTYIVQLCNNQGGKYTGTKLTKFYIAFEKSNSNTMILSVSLKKNNTLELGTVFTQENSTGIIWKSSKKSVASVTKEGVVKALKKGSTTISATAKTGEIVKVIVIVKN